MSLSVQLHPYLLMQIDSGDSLWLIFCMHIRIVHTGSLTLFTSGLNVVHITFTYHTV